MSRIARNVLMFAGAVVFAFAAGNLSGLYFYPQLVAETEEHDHHAADPHDAHEHEDEHLALTKQAFENLGLRLDVAPRGDYWKSLNVPGQVIEIPGKSDLSIAAPVAGIVEKVLVVEGQALGPSDLLFTLRITDDQLTKAQSDLLASLSREEVVEKEIARLAPLTQSGGVSGRLKREMEYERTQIASTQATLKQEIRARGLPEEMLRDVVENKSLATKLTIAVPSFMEIAEDASPETVSLAVGAALKDYSVESLRVHPGKTVRRGEDLCHLAHHADLYIRGQAFEGDVAALTRIGEEGWKIRAEFGHQHQRDHSHTLLSEGLHLLRVDNRVDAETQTFSFYLPLRNEVVKSTSDEQGRSFQQWKFKPGQRVHLSLPVERWKDHILLPRDAVVVEGPNAFVFVEHVEADHDHEHDHADDHKHHDGHDSEHDHAHEEVFVELEPVPVRLLYRDNRTAVIADDGQLPLDERVALGGAAKLHLAMKMQASGGGGHHHHHDH